MVTAIKTYSSVKEIEEAIDKEITDTKSALGEYLRKLDGVRSIAEKSQKIREIVTKLAGKKNGHSEELGEIDVGNVKIILDANASQELKAIEDVVRSYQEYLFVLQNARAALKPLAQLGELEGLNLIVLEKERVPRTHTLKNHLILLKFPSHAPVNDPLKAEIWRKP